MVDTIFQITNEILQYFEYVTQDRFLTNFMLNDDVSIKVISNDFRMIDFFRKYWSNSNYNPLTDLEMIQLVDFVCSSIYPSIKRPINTLMNNLLLILIQFIRHKYSSKNDLVNDSNQMHFKTIFIYSIVCLEKSIFESIGSIKSSFMWAKTFDSIKMSTYILFNKFDKSKIDKEMDTILDPNNTNTSIYKSFLRHAFQINVGMSDTFSTLSWNKIVFDVVTRLPSSYINNGNNDNNIIQKLQFGHLSATSFNRQMKESKITINMHGLKQIWESVLYKYVFIQKELCYYLISVCTFLDPAIRDRLFGNSIKLEECVQKMQTRIRRIATTLLEYLTLFQDWGNSLHHYDEYNQINPDSNTFYHNHMDIKLHNFYIYESFKNKIHKRPIDNFQLEPMPIPINKNKNPINYTSTLYPNRKHTSSKTESINKTMKEINSIINQFTKQTFKDKKIFDNMDYLEMFQISSKTYFDDFYKSLQNYLNDTRNINVMEQFTKNAEMWCQRDNELQQHYLSYMFILSQNGQQHGQNDDTILLYLSNIFFSWYSNYVLVLSKNIANNVHENIFHHLVSPFSEIMSPPKTLKELINLENCKNTFYSVINRIPITLENDLYPLVNEQNNKDFNENIPKIFEFLTSGYNIYSFVHGLFSEDIESFVSKLDINNVTNRIFKESMVSCKNSLYQSRQNIDTLWDLLNKDSKFVNNVDMTISALLSTTSYYNPTRDILMSIPFHYRMLALIFRKNKALIDKMNNMTNDNNKLIKQMLLNGSTYFNFFDDDHVHLYKNKSYRSLSLINEIHRHPNHPQSPSFFLDFDEIIYNIDSKVVDICNAKFEPKKLKRIRNDQLDTNNTDITNSNKRFKVSCKMCGNQTNMIDSKTLIPFCHIQCQSKYYYS